MQTFSFEELSGKALYDVLQLRALVFVVEQNCPYQDLDGLDQLSMHHLVYEDAILVAYTRTIPIGAKYIDAIAISRVVVHPNYRTQGLGLRIMSETLAYLNTAFPSTIVRLSAQFHLQKFYASFGFEVCSDMYLEDEIPHVEMVKFV